MLGIGFSLMTPAVQAVDAPTGYIQLKWIGEEGIASFMRVPNSGYIDYLTVIDLSRYHIKLMATTTPRELEGPGVAPFATGTQNWLFQRAMAESIKTGAPEAKFIWNAPFFNVNMSATVLSLGLKSTDAQGEYINSGVRPSFDMAEPRRMLIIDNKTNVAKIAPFDANIFVNEGDQAVEGFDPFGSPSIKAEQTARVFVGVRNAGKELVVYCSRSASKDEASNALVAAGVSVDQQIQVDGGGSATCGYNLPGQYFVEPGRNLPHLMGAFPSYAKGTVAINNLNVRSGASATSPILRKLALGTTVTIYEEKNGWTRIYNGEWVMSQYVKKVRTFPYQTTVTTDGLNVRTGAGATFSAVRKLKLNTTVTVYEEKGTWVRISDNEWVMGQYVR